MNITKSAITNYRNCKSNNNIKKFQTHYAYSFTDFGQDEKFLKYLNIEYDLTLDTLKGIIYDRKLLVGDYNSLDEPTITATNNPLNGRLLGILNLYSIVVIPFIREFRQSLDEQHNFSTAWLYCPYYNENYKRGQLVISEGMEEKQLYHNQSGTEIITLSNIPGAQNNILPIGTKINFKKGKDLHAFEEYENVYEIENIIDSQNEKHEFDGNAYIKLSLAEKKLCIDDEIQSNFGNYNDTSFSYSNYGFPYWINKGQMKVNKITKREKKNTREELFSWNETQHNWYSYTRKPNTELFGIDCSGTIVNNLANISTEQTHYFTTDSETGALNYENAWNLGEEYCRRIPVEKNVETFSYLINGDIIYINGHIGACSQGALSMNFTNEYVPLESITDRSFEVIHNYGEDGIFIDGGKAKNLCSFKTLQGRFRHWGVQMNSATLPTGKGYMGRLYLWN